MHETDGTIADGNGEGNYQVINRILSKRDDILGIYSVSDGNLGIVHLGREGPRTLLIGVTTREKSSVQPSVKGFQASEFQSVPAWTRDPHAQF